MAPSKTSKKRRISEEPHEPTKPVERNLNEHDFKHEIFTQWSRDRGVQIHNVKPESLPGRGVGLVTMAKIKKDERIAFVPDKAMFKPNASKLGKSAYNAFSKTASPQALLAWCAALELGDPDSTLHKWKATWPTPEELLPSLPLHWTPDMQCLLPESVEQPLSRQRQDYQRDLEHWLENAEESGVSEDEYKYYWAIVNSRSFHFKPPGAKPGHMVLCPFIDYMNHGPSGTGVSVKQTPKGYEVSADRDYEDGEEILATYGAHPNDKLLVHYGFLNASEPGTASDDDIRLDHLLIPVLGETTCSALQDVGYLGGYALLPATNELCFKTEVAVRAKLLTANEWEYFISNGDDLSRDHSAAVRKFVVDEVLMPYLIEATKRLFELQKLDVDSRSGRTRNAEKQVALGLLKQRWEQIRDGVKAFLDDA